MHTVTNLPLPTQETIRNSSLFYRAQAPSANKPTSAQSHTNSELQEHARAPATLLNGFVSQQIFHSDFWDKMFFVLRLQHMPASVEAPAQPDLNCWGRTPQPGPSHWLWDPGSTGSGTPPQQNVSGSSVHTAQLVAANPPFLELIWTRPCYSVLSNLTQKAPILLGTQTTDTITHTQAKTHSPL